MSKAKSAETGYCSYCDAVRAPVTGYACRVCGNRLAGPVTPQTTPVHIVARGEPVRLGGRFGRTVTAWVRADLPPISDSSSGPQGEAPQSGLSDSEGIAQ